jgi:hypothetical protein
MKFKGFVIKNRIYLIAETLDIKLLTSKSPILPYFIRLVPLEIIKA